MHTRSRAWRVGPVLAALLLLPMLAVVGLPSTAGAAPAQIPTPFTAVGSGGILVLADTAAKPTALPVPHPARLAECQDTIDNESGDRIVGGAIVPALDGLIDNGVDPQCSATTDGSELAGNFSGLVQNPQPKEASVFSGTRTGSTVATTSRVFPKGYLGAATTTTVTAWWVIEAGLSISGTTGTSNADGSGTITINGSVLAKFARQSCSGLLCFGAPNNGTCSNDTGSPGTINFTTETSGPLTGKRYDDVTKTMVLVSDGFVIPTVNASALCDQLETQLGLGTANNQAAIALSFAPTAGCGTSPVFNAGATCWQPVLNDPTAPTTAFTGDTVTLDGSNSYDPGYTGTYPAANPPPGSVLTYNELTSWGWTQTGGTAVTVSPVANTANKQAQVTFPSAGSYQFTFTGSGNQHYPALGTKVVNITVSDPVGQISGTITDEGGPLSGVSVSVYKANAPGRVATATTDGSGNYSLPNLQTGSYRLRALDPTGGHVTEWYNNAGGYDTGTNISVGAGSNVDVDVQMADASVLWGRVINNQTNDRAAGVTVTLYQTDGTFVGTAVTGTAGYYKFGGLPGGSYLVKFQDPAYYTEWFKGTQIAANAQVINVPAATTVTLNGANDAYVTPAGQPELSGTVTAQVGGAPISAAQVRVYTADGLVGTTTTNGSGQWTYGGIDRGTTYYVRFGKSGFTNEWYDNAGPLFDDCSNVVGPCTPTVVYATPLSYTGTALTTVNGSLS